MRFDTEQQKWILTESHTRELLAVLAKCRKNPFGRYYPCGPWNEDGPPVGIDEIKAELAKRPHIPNKKESKELRRQRIKKGY